MTPTPIDQPPTAKRRKYSHHPEAPICSREEEEQRLPLLVPSSSHPSSTQSSPLQPTTPDHNSQSSDRSCSTESLAWSFPARLDEIELLSVIEKHAETYSNEVVNSPPNPPLPTEPHPSSTPHPSFNPINHQDNKPYKCTLCPKAFTRNYDLTRHKSSHQDQRQHVCTKCGRSFNRRDALIRHTLVRGCGTTT